METSIQFSDGYILDGNTVVEAKKTALESIKQVLPDDAKRFDVIRYILEETKEMVSASLLR